MEEEGPLNKGLSENVFVSEHVMCSPGHGGMRFKTTGTRARGPGLLTPNRDAGEVAERLFVKKDAVDQPLNPSHRAVDGRDI